MTVDAVLFDLDGTLLDSAPRWEAALEALARRRGRALPDGVRELRGVTTREVVRRLHGALGPAPATATVDVEAEVTWASDVAWVEEHVRQSLRARSAWAAGALDLLAEVRRRGVATGLVTSNCASIVGDLLATPDAPRFDVVVCVDDVVRAKPDPEPYRTAARRLGVAPQRCVAVEDSAPGLASALGAGCRVVAIGGSVPGAAGLVRVDTIAALDPQVLLGYPVSSGKR